MMTPKERDDAQRRLAAYKDSPRNYRRAELIHRDDLLSLSEEAELAMLNAEADDLAAPFDREMLETVRRDAAWLEVRLKELGVPTP